MATKVKIRGVEHDFDPSRMTFREGKKVQQWTGQTFSEWGKSLRSGDIDALSAYALLILQRSDPAARMDTIDAMGMDELEFVADPEPCPVCGELPGESGECGADGEGRPIVHVRPKADESAVAPGDEADPSLAA